MKNIKEINSFEELNLKMTFRAHIIYEKIMGHSFDTSDGLNGIVVLFFSYVLGSNRDANLDYEEFMDWLDEHPEMITKFSEWLVSGTDARNHMPSNEEPKETKSEEAPNKEGKKE